MEIRLLCDLDPNSNDKAMELEHSWYPRVMKKLTHLVGTSDIACVMCNWVSITNLNTFNNLVIILHALSKLSHTIYGIRFHHVHVT